MDCIKHVQRLPEDIVEYRHLRDATELRLDDSNLIALPERFRDLPSLEDLNMGYCHALANNEGTYAILSSISTLTKLSLLGCNMGSLPEGSP